MKTKVDEAGTQLTKTACIKYYFALKLPIEYYGILFRLILSLVVVVGSTLNSFSRVLSRFDELKMVLCLFGRSTCCLFGC